MITQLPKHAQIAVALWLAYWLLAFAYSLATPVFEAPDEHHHFFTAVAIADTWKLPVAGENLARQEAAQPPLYYILGALLIAPLETKAALWFNPYVQPGVATAGANKNAFVHTEAWPWPAYVWAVQLLRGFSIALGSVTLWAIYRSARLLWPGAVRRALLALALVAFLPQFLFLHASITNDTLIIALCALAIWQVLRLWLLAEPHFRRKRLFWLGLTLGTAVLSKTAGLLLLLWVAAALAWLVWRYGGADGRFRWRDIFLFTLLPALLVSGWLLWRNWVLYGDPSAAAAFIELAGGDRGFTVWQALAQFGRVWQSLFAFFGWMTVQPPGWVYGLWYAVVVTGVVGGVGLAYREMRKRPIASSPHLPLALWLAGWVLLVFIGWLQFMMRTPADQGRLLFPALLPLALALAYGLSWFRYSWLAAAAALLTALTCLVVVIPNAYARPPLLAQLPATAVSLGVAGGVALGDLELVAVELLDEVVSPGDWVQMRLYWRLVRRPSAPPVEVIEIFGRQMASVGKLHSYHGHGLYPANLWPAEGIIAETIAVQLDGNMAAPTVARLFVKLLDAPGEVEVGQVKVAPTVWPAAETAVLAQFGDGIELTRADLQPTATGLALHLRWQVTAPPQKEFIVFVHLGEPTQPPLLQADGPPLGGDYPTYLWAAGEVMEDVVMLALPAELADGSHPIHIGLYDPASGLRLPLVVQGERQALDAYWVGNATSR